MRLDLFLKHTRLLRRRTVAQDAVEDGSVLLNGRPTKPGKPVRVGDILTFPGGEGENPRKIRILQEALRPVPKGREGDFYREDG